MSVQNSTAAARKAKSQVALALTFAAGFVDVVGYIAFYHLFTAHMTGTTVHAAMDLVHEHWPQALVALSLVAAFVGGSVLARAVMEIGQRKRVRSVASITLLFETTLILAVALSHLRSGAYKWEPLLLAAAMGVQTATLTKVGPLTVHTTFVTGMLNKFAQLLSHALILSYDVARGRARARPARAKLLRQSAYIFAIWGLYLVGGTAGALAGIDIGLRALVIPASILIVAIFVDQVRPLSFEEQSPLPTGK